MYKELFKFVENDLTYTLTSADEDEVYNSETYASTPLGRSKTENKGQLAKENLTIEFDLYNPIAGRWLQGGFKITVSCFELNDEGVEIFFKGRLVQIKPEGSKIKAVFESIFTSAKSTSLAFRAQRTCPYVHYGRGCRLNKADFEEAGTATAINELVVTVTEAASFPNGFFKNGILEAPDGSSCYIVNHIGNQLTLIRRFYSLELEIATNGDTAVKMYPGCDRSLQVCDEVFDNLLNNGAKPYMPTRNPWGGGPIV